MQASIIKEIKEARAAKLNVGLAQRLCSMMVLLAKEESGKNKNCELVYKMLRENFGELKELFFKFKKAYPKNELKKHTKSLFCSRGRCVEIMI